ncbi:hypothetical protein GTW66_15465 [Streptomyces sp. SID5473]|uniref:hypothetical protein n=1 Tax=Streptomyces sp. SID5473 TaxID=2690299 RepID=UPI00131E154D|nr:hypothetical protein [Streptomyces sp. SID5473]MYS65405.1 hypothetical protein [Streptomyces sp. SID5473]
MSGRLSVGSALTGRLPAVSPSVGRLSVGSPPSREPAVRPLSPRAVVAPSAVLPSRPPALPAASPAVSWAAGAS